MQPSSDHSGSGAPGGGALRRWGPIAAIVVVIAVVAAVVLMGGDDDSTDTSATTETTVSNGDAPEGAVSFSRAKAENLDVTFADTCDQETGRLAMPYYFAPECYANADDNGGATAPGVTADEIKVVVYVAPETDPVLDFITAPIANDDTPAQIEETYQGFTDMFNAYMQTYGRTVKLEFLHGSGTSDDEVAARADAVKAMDEMGAFAVWGGPVLSNAWTQEIKARGGVCIGCPALDDQEPSVFTVAPSADQTRAFMVEYVTKKLMGKPAEHAGQPDFVTKERVFGHLWIDTGSADAQQGADDLKQMLADEGVELAEQIGYELNPGTLQEQASTIIARLKEAGVTSVIIGGDPIAPKTFTEVATAQDYHPEWVMGTATLQDVTAFARTYDQDQWSHAFGFSYLTARLATGLGAPDVLYEWWTGTLAPADDSVGVLWPNPGTFFAGVQAAGPNLTAESFRDGLFSFPIDDPAITQPSINYGEHGLWDFVDYSGIDDVTEIWWDPTAQGDDELRRAGTGMYRYVDGGKRYLVGDLPTDTVLFDEAGTVTVYDEIPAAEAPPDAPPPKKG
jgi:hypothetical protein